VHARARSLRRGNRRAAAGRHVHPPTSPTTHTAATPEKARPSRITVATTASLKRPGPSPSEDDPRAAQAQGSENPTLEGCKYRPVVPKPAQQGGRHRCPRYARITDQRLVGRAYPRALEPRRCEKSGAPSCHPVVALLITGSKPDPQRVRTGAPDRQSQGRRGRAQSSLSSSPPARGCPTCRVQEPARAASRGDPIEGELPRPRPLANGTEPHLANPHKRFHGRVSRPRANPYRTGHGRPLESPDNSSMRNPQFATRPMGVAETSPSSPRRDGEGAYKTSRRAHPDRFEMGPGSGARRAATPPRVHRTQAMPVMRAWPKPAGTSPMPVETNTLHAGMSHEKPLQEHSCSCRASEARPTGPLTRPHGTALATRREECPIS
jgi:hypothetical protein